MIKNSIEKWEMILIGTLPHTNVIGHYIQPKSI